MINKRVLVTGANGQLGLTIKELFFKNNENIEFVFVEKVELDISNLDRVKAFFKENDFNYCINCAAYTNVEQAEESSSLAFNINAESVKNLAITCYKTNTILIHISTDYVFNGKKDTPYKETDVTDPLNEYGKSKLQGEKFIIDNSENYFIIRTSWLYSKHGKNFFKTIVNKIKENTSLKITTAETGTPTSCIDLADFIYSLIVLENKCFGLYHFSNQGESTWYGFALEIAGYFKNYDISKISPVDFFKTKAIRPKYSVLSKEKVKAISKKKIKDWRESLKDVMRSMSDK